MDTPNKLTLDAPLTPHEIIWVSDLADKLPEDVDLTFEESKILTRSLSDFPTFVKIGFQISVLRLL
jgi:hypothetical protein